MTSLLGLLLAAATPSPAQEPPKTIIIDMTDLCGEGRIMEMRRKDAMGRARDIAKALEIETGRPVEIEIWRGDLQFRGGYGQFPVYSQIC